MGVFVQTRICSETVVIGFLSSVEPNFVERTALGSLKRRRPRPRVLFDERRGTQRSEFNRSTFFWCCIAKAVRNTSQIMRLRKVCPQCGITVHVKRSRCACGHAFALKRKALLTADNQRELATVVRT